MKKEEKIKEAYKKYFNESDVDHRMYISINGWSDKLNLELINYDGFLKELDIRQTTFRPKSLQGIDDNNGWIKIESEDDLPKENGMYHVHYADGVISSRYYYLEKNDWLKEPKATHYQPIVKPLKPIY